MNLKGLEKFREKLPGLPGKRIIILPLYAITILTFLIFSIRFFYTLPTKLSTNAGFYFPIIGVILIDIFGVLMADLMWFLRNKMKAKYNETAYQRMLFIGFWGIESLIFLAFNSFFPIKSVNPQIWGNSPSFLWVTSFTSLISGNWIILNIIRWIIGVFLLILGIITIFRSLFTFGIDYMAVVYLYFPEESEPQNNQIYSILRNPTYAGLIYICLGGFIFYFSLFNLLYFIIYLIGFEMHLNFVEEKELIARFGEPYIKYRQKVQRIFVHPKNWGKYFRILLGKKLF
ncbi:MAG: methyltransferase family protein [Promethearchaeota archaeon]